MAAKPPAKTTGIDVRHARSCAHRNGGDCDCKPTYQAHVYDARSKRLIRKTFPTFTGARNWRQDALVALRSGTLRASDGRTVEQVANEWLKGAREGVIRNRSGDHYKPSAIRAYEQNLRLRVLPALGRMKFTAVRRIDVQDLVDRLHARGDMSASNVQCTILPLRAIYRRALARGEVVVNPTVGLELPAIRSRRDRIVSPGEAATLLEALPGRDCALWATAMYAGLRRGELQALRWEDVDLERGVICVRRGWDAKEGEIAPKSAVGKRTVPIPAILNAHLRASGLLAVVAGMCSATVIGPLRRSRLKSVCLLHGRISTARLSYYEWPRFSLDWNAEQWVAAIGGADVVIVDSSRLALSQVDLDENSANDYASSLKHS